MDHPTQHKTKQDEYKSWVRAVINDPFQFLHQFVDWCEENRFRPQRWREVLGHLPNVKALYHSIDGSAVCLVTKHRSITISMFGKNGNKEIRIQITKRWQRNQVLQEKGYTLALSKRVT